MTKTVRNVRNEIRANFNAATERQTEGTATNGVVRAQGEVRGVVARAANDVVNAVRAGRPDKATDEVANGPTTVAKSFRDTAKKVVKDVRQAAKDAREAAKDGRRRRRVTASAAGCADTAAPPVEARPARSAAAARTPR